MFLALLLPTLLLHVVACPQLMTGAWVMNCGGAVARPYPVAGYRSRLVLVMLVMAAGPAPVTPPPLGTAPRTCLYAHSP